MKLMLVFTCEDGRAAPCGAKDTRNHNTHERRAVRPTRPRYRREMSQSNRGYDTADDILGTILDCVAVISQR